MRLLERNLREMQFQSGVIGSASSTPLRLNTAGTFPSDAHGGAAMRGSISSTFGGGGGGISSKQQQTCGDSNFLGVPRGGGGTSVSA